MEVQLVSQSARCIWVWFIATCLVAAHPAAVAAQGFDPPPTPMVPSHPVAASDPAPRPGPVVRPGAKRPVRFERLPAVARAAAPVLVVERLPSVEDVLVNPAKAAELSAAAAEARSAAIEANTPSPRPSIEYKEFELAQSSKPVKPVRPSTLTEPTALAKRTPRSYAELNPQRTQNGAESQQFDVVNTLARVSAIAETQIVQRHIQTGFTLAHRGAYYSAKSEFEQALRVIAESLDAQQLDGKHGEQLTAAFDALEEADAFFVDDPRSGGRINLGNIAITHRTPLLQEGKLEGLNQVAAMQAYYAYAQQQLREAVGREEIAADALYGLGKTYTALAGADGAVGHLHGPKSLLMHQVAAQVNPQHPLAANELGVLLARFGQWEEAKQALLQTPPDRRLPESWHNLAVVHQHLGEKQLADAAQRESIAARQAQVQQQVPTYQENGVEWYDVSAAETMARHQAPADQTTPRAAARPAPAQQWPWSTPR